MKTILFFLFSLMIALNCKSQDFNIHEFGNSWVLEYKTDTFSILQTQNALLRDSLFSIQFTQGADTTLLNLVDSLQLEIVGKDQIITTLNDMMNNQTQLNSQKLYEISNFLLFLRNSLDSVKTEVDSVKIPVYNIVFPDSSYYQYHND